MMTTTHTSPSRPLRLLFVGEHVHENPRRVERPLRHGRDLDTFDYVSAIRHNSMHMDESIELTYSPSLTAPTTRHPKSDNNHSVANKKVVLA